MNILIFLFLKIFTLCVNMDYKKLFLLNFFFNYFIKNFLFIFSKTNNKNSFKNIIVNYYYKKIILYKKANKQNE